MANLNDLMQAFYALWSGVTASDALANPTAPQVLGHAMVWDGTQWVRVKSWANGPVGNQIAVIGDGVNGGYLRVYSPADGTAAALASIASASTNMLYNGTTEDLQRGVTEATLLASASRTTTQTSADLVNYNASWLQVTLDMTVVGTGSVTLAIQGKDSVSGKYRTLLAGAAVVTNVTNVYEIDIQKTAVANGIAKERLPRVWRIVVTANNANAATYSVGYVLGLY